MENKRDTFAGLIGWVLLLWAAANFAPYLLVYLFSGQPFYQALPEYFGWPVEAGLHALNLGLPLWWLRQRGIPWREGLAWRWEGRRSWLWGLGGLAVTLIWGWVVTLLILVPEVSSAEGQSYSLFQLLPLLLGLLALWSAAIVGEEGMFRGWTQTQLEASGPTWLSVLLPALLFGLRHLPLDLHTGHAGLAGWAARMVELYGWALIMGLIRWRTCSIAPTVILHGVLWPLVIVGLLDTAIGAAMGAVLGVVVIICVVLAAKKQRLEVS